MTNILRLIDFSYNVKKVLTFYIFVSNIGNTKCFHDVYSQYLHESKKTFYFCNIIWKYLWHWVYALPSFTMWDMNCACWDQFFISSVKYRHFCTYNTRDCDYYLITWSVLISFIYKVREIPRNTGPCYTIL